MAGVNEEHGEAVPGAAACFHCGLPVPAGSHYTVTIDGQAQTLCCVGCQAVAQAIVDNDLLDFYRLRTRDSQRAAALVPEELKQLRVYDSGLMQRSFVRHHDQDVREAALILEGI
ncbi:MAG: heavy metal translocating P-type ATPase metal-binding domain-containing protein, partial [Thiothrix sp.]|nr:heavy metal translocating P-type ATPase metal-binding domain-containing protein [Thiothrix sp.]